MLSARLAAAGEDDARRGDHAVVGRRIVTLGQRDKDLRLRRALLQRGKEPLSAVLPFPRGIRAGKLARQGRPPGGGVAPANETGQIQIQFRSRRPLCQQARSPAPIRGLWTFLHPPKREKPASVHVFGGYGRPVRTQLKEGLPLTCGFSKRQRIGAGPRARKGPDCARRPEPRLRAHPVTRDGVRTKSWTVAFYTKRKRVFRSSGCSLPFPSVPPRRNFLLFLSCSQSRKPQMKWLPRAVANSVDRRMK